MSDDLQSNSTFLTVAEVATMMRLSRTTVYRLVQNRKLPAVQFGRSIRVPESAVREYIAGATLDEVPPALFRD